MAVKTTCLLDYILNMLHQKSIEKTSSFLLCRKALFLVPLLLTPILAIAVKPKNFAVTVVSFRSKSRCLPLPLVRWNPTKFVF